jgi:hypothetical protein
MAMKRLLTGFRWTSLTLSAFLLVLVSGLWVRSYFAMDRIWVDVHPADQPELGWGLLCLQSGKGGWGFWYNRIRAVDPANPDRPLKLMHGKTTYRAYAPQYPNEWDGASKGSFYWVNEHASRQGQLPIFVGQVVCSVPYWPVWLLTLPGTIGLCVKTTRSMRTRRRNRAHLCTACGYDLRASKDRCPECGAPFFVK